MKCFGHSRRNGIELTTLAAFVFAEHLSIEYSFIFSLKNYYLNIEESLPPPKMTF
jgi:hypothetical protein